MYFLIKCNSKGCKRIGSVALTADADFCNIHSKNEQSQETTEEVKQEESEIGKKPRLTDPDNE